MSAPIQLQQLPRRKKPAPKRALLYLALLLSCLLWLVGCSAEAASEQPLSKQELVAQSVCGKGHTAVWIDSTTHECMREMRDE